MIRYEYGRSIGAPAKSEVELRCKSQISSRKFCFHGLQSVWGIMKPRKAQLGALSLKEPSLGQNRKPSFVHREESPAGNKVQFCEFRHSKQRHTKFLAEIFPLLETYILCCFGKTVYVSRTKAVQISQNALRGKESLVFDNL